MASLTAWKLNTVDGAEKLLEVLKQSQSQQILKIQDGAIVTWDASKKKPKTEQLVGLAGAGALGGAFWGMLFGLIFLVPFVGMAIGAAMGALAGHFSDYGIDDKFIESVKAEVTPGTSALFLLTESSAPDRVIDAVKAAGLEPTLIASNLTKAQEDRLRGDFGDE
ncbi:MAG: DUF1269 domain-containing protein [Thermomicrobiales bacterium]